MPAVHGVVRWRACDLIMRLYEEFGLSVSDDTIYRALKNLGFSHVSGHVVAGNLDLKSNIQVFKNFPFSHHICNQPGWGQKKITKQLHTADGPYRARRNSGTIDCYGHEQPNHSCGIFRIPEMPDESASPGDRRARTGHLLRRHRGAHIVHVQSGG